MVVVVALQSANTSPSKRPVASSHPLLHRSCCCCCCCLLLSGVPHHQKFQPLSALRFPCSSPFNLSARLGKEGGESAAPAGGGGGEHGTRTCSLFVGGARELSSPSFLASIARHWRTHTHTRALQEWEWSPPDGVTTVRAERRVVTRDYKHLHCTCVSHLTPSRTHAQLQLQHFNFRSPTFTRGGQVQLTHINKQKETSTVHSDQNLVTVSTVDIFVYISPSALSVLSKCAMTQDE